MAWREQTICAYEQDACTTMKNKRDFINWWNKPSWPTPYFSCHEALFRIWKPCWQNKLIKWIKESLLLLKMTICRYYIPQNSCIGGYCKWLYTDIKNMFLKSVLSKGTCLQVGGERFLQFGFLLAVAFLYLFWHLWSRGRLVHRGIRQSLRPACSKENNDIT